MKKKEMIVNLLTGCLLSHSDWPENCFIYLDKEDESIKDQEGKKLSSYDLLNHLQHASDFLIRGVQ